MFRDSLEPLEARVEVSETGGDRVAARHEGRRTVTIGANRRCAGVAVPTRSDPSAASDTGAVTLGILYGVNYFPDEERYAGSVAVLPLSMEQTTGDGPEPPWVTLAASAETAVEGAALEYTLSRTGPVEEALAVDLDVSETGAMLAAYPSRVPIPSGQATAAFTIATLDDEADEEDSVVTVEIAADGENYTLGDPASAAVTVTDDDEAALPLTSSFANVPASHDGESVFTFELRFSEEFPIGYKKLQNHAFEVTGGRVTQARRLEKGSNLRWEIAVEPDGDNAVTVALPATGDCDSGGAICAEDGRMLSNRTELTVAGPVEEEEEQPEDPQPENSPATGAPVIRGTAQVGETLTADTSGIADEDGIKNASFSYQWVADDTAIQGATGSTYTLAESDEGKAVRVRVSFTDDAGNEESLTSVATDEVEARPNSPATGAPGISGTALVGETFTADTSGIADEDGMDSASFSYQWISNYAGTDSEIDGATGSTYTVATDDVGKTVRVRVSFTDDRGHRESLTSAATASVAGLPPLPLTASVQGVPASHDGESGFTFELRFSEEPRLGYKRLRDHAFTVTGGTVNKAERLEKGSNTGWRVTVQPDGNGGVTVVLPATTDCDSQGAICTADGQKLSNRLELTVGGP